MTSWSNFDKTRFTRTMNIAQMGLNNSSLRQQTITNNIANIDTPHYKRKMISFESELNRVISKEQKTSIPFRMTNAHHLPLEDPKHYLDVSPQLHEEYDSNYRNDKNNVDVEKEMSDLVQNTMYFNASTAIVSSGFKRMNSVISNA